ncbi:hypothetical protein [Halobacteriovorax marinus]|uniref:hypothetical protein n=1 Tax=Halobacteriovorax marinus TaxID=97084 RepID=UPI003A952FD9
MVYSLFASLLTYELSKVRFIGPIRSSSLVGILIYLVSLYLDFLNSSILFGATFVGMCSSNKVNRIELVIATIIYLFAFSVMERYFSGVGGLLGMSSFVGVCTVFILRGLHRKFLKR